MEVVLFLAFVFLFVLTDVNESQFPSDTFQQQLTLPGIGKLSGFDGLKPNLMDQRKIEMKKIDPTLRIILHQAKIKEKPLLANFSEIIGVYSNQTPLIAPMPLEKFEDFLSFSFSFSFISPPGDRVGVLIRAKDVSKIKLTGAEIGTISGDVITARVTLEQLMRIAFLPEVTYIEAAYRLEPKIDKSVPEVGGLYLHQNEPTALGRGVIAGVVDSGIDYDHLDFRYDGDGDSFEESSRILFIWDQTQPSFGFGVPYGVEYTREDIESDIQMGFDYTKGLVRQHDHQGHGTHVTGIFAGDGSSSDLYIGMAPQAEIIVVKTSFFTTDVVDGVSYIFTKADGLQRPAVVNLSLGGHFGPHDGTSNFERALDNLIEPGCIIVTSAGNEGNKKIHIGGFLSNKSKRFTFLAQNSLIYLNFWYSGSDEIEIEITSPSGRKIKAPKGETAFVQLPDGNVSIDNASAGPNPNNGDNQIVVILDGIEEGTLWGITLRGKGRFDGWVGLSYMGEFLEGDNEMTISEPGNAHKIITTGAYTTKYDWESIDGNRYHFSGSTPVGTIAPFSSRGPTRDGRQKPDITAPGTAIASALSSNSELAKIIPLVISETHAILAGTSMSAPHVAGTVVLMLEGKRNLTPQEIANRLKGTARSDAYTGLTPNLTWGFGKLNAAKGFDTIGLDEDKQVVKPQAKVSNPAVEKAYFFYALPEDTLKAEIMIFDVAGRVVFRQELDPTKTRFIWDLRNSKGRLLAKGLYIFMIVADGMRSEVGGLVIQ